MTELNVGSVASVRLSPCVGFCREGRERERERGSIKDGSRQESERGWDERVGRE